MSPSQTESFPQLVTEGMLKRREGFEVQLVPLEMKEPHEKELKGHVGTKNNPWHTTMVEYVQEEGACDETGSQRDSVARLALYNNSFLRELIPGN